MKNEVLYIKQIEVARRSLTVSKFLPPISRLEYNAWVRDKNCSLLGKCNQNLMKLERERRKVCSALLQNIAAIEQSFFHQISFDSTEDGIKVPSSVFSEKALSSQLFSLLQQQIELNIQTYYSLFHWEDQEETLLLTSLDSMLSFCIISLQLLSLCCYANSLFTPSHSLRSRIDSLEFIFPPHATISSSLHSSLPLQTDSFYQHLLDVLQSAYLGIQALEQTNPSQQDAFFLLSNYRKAVEIAFEAYLQKDTRPNPVDEPPEEVCEGDELPQYTLPQAEKEGVMYIYQGISTRPSNPLKRESHPPTNSYNRQLRQELVREVILLQQQEFDSIPTEIVGETESPKSEPEEQVDKQVVSFFSFLPKREFNGELFK